MFASLLTFLWISPLFAADPAEPSVVPANPDGSCPPDSAPMEGGGCLGNLGALVGMKGVQLGSSGTGSAPPAQIGADGTTTLAADPIVLGELKKAEIDPVMKEHLPSIRGCYQAQLARRPELAGKVVMKFVVAKDGTVSSATVKSTTLNSPETEGCMIAEFGKMRFPAPRGGGIVIVSYPFEFSTTTTAR